MTTFGCLSVPGCRVPLPVLESLAISREALPEALTRLQATTSAVQLLVLSTCERTEVYGCWAGPPELEAVVAAVAEQRAVPAAVVDRAATRMSGREAALHLLRVTAGLESFVLGERDIVGQVRIAAERSRAAGTVGLELERLVATAINTSRRVHRSTRFAEKGGSVATAAVRQAARLNGGDLAGRRVLVVGAGQVATEATITATALGATVTVCNRTRRHAERLAAAGAAVVDLTRLPEVLTRTDVAVFATAAPHRLLTADQLAGLPRAATGELLVLDLCVPRNVEPGVRSLAGVTLLDLSDLRLTAADPAVTLSDDVAVAESIVEAELDGYLSWLARRAATVSVRRLRAGMESCARNHAEQAARRLPDELRPLLEDAVVRAVRQLAHAPTTRLLEAAEAGDERTVSLIADLFAGG